jgi:hypothetical protein
LNSGWSPQPLPLDSDNAYSTVVTSQPSALSFYNDYGRGFDGPWALQILDFGLLTFAHGYGESCTVRTRLLGLALGVPLWIAAPARADIFAVAPVVAPGHSDIDIGLLDLSTGTSLPLPAGVNTGANENHPTISTDGHRLAFERRDHAAGTDRLIVADLGTGQMMDLFNAFDTATLKPTSLAINKDGDWVTTGSDGSGLHGRSLGNFPNSVSAADLL